jgi:hypothetical protein
MLSSIDSVSIHSIHHQSDYVPRSVCFYDLLICIAELLIWRSLRNFSLRFGSKYSIWIFASDSGIWLEDVDVGYVLRLQSDVGLFLCDLCLNLWWFAATYILFEFVEFSTSPPFLVIISFDVFLERWYLLHSILRPNWICVNLLEVFLMLNADSPEAMIWKLVLCLVNMKFEDRLQWFQTIVCAFIIFCWSLMWRFWFHSNWCLRFRELVCYCGYSFWKLLHFGSDGDVKFRSNNLVLDLVCSHLKVEEPIWIMRYTLLLWGCIDSVF